MAVAASLTMAPAAEGDSESGWWEARSPDERQTIVNYFYRMGGHNMPYPAAASQAESLVTELRGATPEASRGRLGTQVAKTGIRHRLLPALKTWAPRLIRKTPGLITATVAIGVEWDIGKRLYARWSLDLNDYGTSVNVSSVEYYPEGVNIYEGVTSRGEWLVNGTIGYDTFNPVRWWDPPCTFSGFTPPAGAHMRNVPTPSSQCAYPISVDPYIAYAHINVNYPYYREDDLHLLDYPVLDQYGNILNDYSVNRVTPPLPAEVEPGIESDLEADGADELRHRLLVAIATDRILENNPDAVADGSIDRQTVRKVADQCVTQAARTPVMETSDCGRRGLPMFVAGRLDYEEATNHVLGALDYALKNATQWAILRYYKRPGNSLDWRLKHPETDDADGVPPFCKGSLLDGTDCDEYPFFATEQGEEANSAGIPHALLPHLKIINASHNRGMGAKYLHSLINPCVMQMRRDNPNPQYGLGHFLVVAVPAPVPTFGLCNGPNPP